MITEEQAIAADWERAYDEGLRSGDYWLKQMGPKLDRARLIDEINEAAGFWRDTKDHDSLGRFYLCGYRDALAEKLQKML